MPAAMISAWCLAMHRSNGPDRFGPYDRNMIVEMASEKDAHSDWYERLFIEGDIHFFAEGDKIVFREVSKYLF